MTLYRTPGTSRVITYGYICSGTLASSILMLSGLVKNSRHFKALRRSYLSELTPK